jgi:hypothetical protein
LKKNKFNEKNFLFLKKRNPKNSHKNVLCTPLLKHSFLPLLSSLPQISAQKRVWFGEVAPEFLSSPFGRERSMVVGFAHNSTLPMSKEDTKGEAKPFCSICRASLFKASCKPRKKIHTSKSTKLHPLISVEKKNSKAFGSVCKAKKEHKVPNSIP